MTLGGLLVLLGWMAGGFPLRRLARLLRQARWLLLSIVLLYAWMTPGTPLLAGLAAGWQPSREGVALALHQLGVLVVLIAAAGLLLNSQGEQRLVAGLLQLLWPLRRIGMPTERFAVRLVLTLSAVAQLQPQMGSGVPGQGGRLQRASGMAARWLDAVLERADRCEPAVIELPAMPPVPWWHWGLPVLLTLLFWWL